MSVRELVGRAQAGDLGAFDGLVARYQDAVFGTALALLGNRADAEDAAQEAFVQAWRDLSALREPEAFAGWLRRIATNRCRDVLRRSPRRWGVGERTVARADPIVEASRRALRDRVLQAVQSLSEPNRLAVTLFYIDGYSVQEVADFLEAPVGTVKRRLHDSRRRLREEMTDMVRESLEGEKPETELRVRVQAELQARRAHWDSLLHEPAEDGDVGWAKWFHDRRMLNVRANAAQYGIEPDETLPRMTPGYRQSETFRDDRLDLPRRWGVPEGLDLAPLRDLCRQLVASPLSVHRWETQGLPVLRYWPWALYDRARVTEWVERTRPEPVQPMTAEQARRPLLTVLEAVAGGLATADEGAELLQNLESASILRMSDALWEPVWQAAHDQERRENAAQYGLAEPTDNWLGIPQDRIPHQWDVRDLSRRIGVSPIDIVRLTRQGMPCLRYSPCVRWDIDRVTTWLQEHGLLPTRYTVEELDFTELFVCSAVAKGEATPDEAYEALAPWFWMA